MNEPSEGAIEAAKAPEPSGSPEAAALEGELAEAEADVARLRTENARIADDFRKDPSDAGREILKRAAASLSSARDRVDAAQTAIEILKRTGSLRGLLAEGGRVVGSVAVLIKPGATREERSKAIDDALATSLIDAAAQLGAVLVAAPERFTRERPGRDKDGRTVLDVLGRIEGDKLVPAISKASKSLRQ